MCAISGLVEVRRIDPAVAGQKISPDKKHKILNRGGLLGSEVAEKFSASAPGYHAIIAS